MMSWFSCLGMCNVVVSHLLLQLTISEFDILDEQVDAHRHEGETDSAKPCITQET